MKRVVIGTAGHVDHGKTTLLKALTGVDTDRLPEEKRRGMSIEIGFAPLRIGDDLTIGFVDVPGHERLVGNMLAGATGVEGVLLTVSSADGIFAQTEEHVEIYRLLGIRHWICALTKSDLVSDADIAARTMQILKYFSDRFIPPPAVIPVSSITRSGLPELIGALRSLSTSILERRARIDSGKALLHVDRVFSKTGFGTVVTGTLISGSLAVDQTIRLHPGAVEAKVRGLEIFGDEVPEAHAATRVAVNLSHVKKEEVHKGMLVTTDINLSPVQTAWAKFDLLLPIEKVKKLKLRGFFGTSDADLKVFWSKMTPNGEAQIQFGNPAFIKTNDRVLLRTVSPPKTVGSAKITRIENNLKKKEIVTAAPSIKIPSEIPLGVIEVIRKGRLEPPPIGDLAKETGMSEGEFRKILAVGMKTGAFIRVSSDVYVLKSELETPTQKLKEHFKTEPTMTIAQWKVLVGLSRKYAVPLLEYFDREKITLCRPDRSRVPGPKWPAS